MRLLLLLTLAVFAFSNCADDSKDPLEIPATYDGTSFAANTADERGLLDRLTALTDEAKKGRVNGVTVQASALNTLYTTGSPSLKSRSTAYFAGLMEGNNGIMNQLALSSGGTYVPGPPTGQGGTFGGYLFDENGLELEQLLEKGNFGAILYHHALSLRNGSLTPATSDKLVAIFGATPSFSNSGSNNVAASVRDRAMANYAARRDKNDGNGFYTRMKTAFITLQAALKAGSAYNKERDEALNTIFDIWEKVNAATVINYCHSVITTMSATSTTEAQRASALHANAEAIGFLHGWRQLPANGRRITDAQIDALLVQLNAPYNGTPTSYLFITEPATQLPKLQQVIAQLKTIYSFTDAEINDFRNNWVNVQGR
jgi:hypothetical protein